jgi:O-antigen/teichoic acid export membrane protein
VGPELLPALASEKYASAAPVLSWVIAGMAVDGTNAMMGAGLFIQRKTRVIMSIVVCCAALNIGLNLVLVPRIGIIGAAIATLVSYSVTALALGTAGRRLLRVPLPWMTILRAGLAAAIMFVAIRHVLPGHRLLTVGVRMLLGAPIYLVLMRFIDADARALLQKPIDRLRRLAGHGERAS